MAGLPSPLPGARSRFNAKTLWHLAADFGWVAGATMDPLTPASKAAKAVLLDPGEFRTHGGNARPLRLHVGRGFQAGELKDRVARNGKLRGDRRLGVRLEPKISVLCT